MYAAAPTMAATPSAGPIDERTDLNFPDAPSASRNDFVIFEPKVVILSPKASHPPKASVATCTDSGSEPSHPKAVVPIAVTACSAGIRSSMIDMPRSPTESLNLSNCPAAVSA